MKRDLELIRKILLHVEEFDNLQFDLPGYDQATIASHVRLLIQAKFLIAIAHTEMGGAIHLQDGITQLTWEGYEFLDAARNDERWKNAMKIAKEKAGSISVSALTQLLVQLMKKAIGL